MMRFAISGFFMVFCVAALKTALVVTFILDPAYAGIATTSGLFALFFALTSGVAYLCFTQVKSYMDGQHKKRLAPGEGTPAAKESVIARYAPDWGLSRAEADVAIFVAKGFSNSEVAEMRGCAIATVKSQLGSIYQKSGLGSRYQLISFVTDEVCAMANEIDDGAGARRGTVETRSILPLSGRAKFREQAEMEA
ncbi:helix-turn-helix transcriptional regulator [Sulfitobacter sp. F26169L]|uniref:helix-turn-helix transcriptional regulator n=1 Tax=Sulfitobacter sp. F26169L TaxID=2996015 RepID=UPI0022609F60|nr:helix-turn-helix transcriptional regulator [Sulfitobacter sp. F26169L]MCX7565071.1 helix-turn-helix transcriptional regulator [Sulfitobacter sp. F26169L]